MLFLGLLLLAAWAIALLLSLLRIEALLREVRDQTRVFASFSEEFERRARLDGTTRSVWQREAGASGASSVPGARPENGSPDTEPEAGVSRER